MSISVACTCVATTIISAHSIFFLHTRPPPQPTLFPYTTLFRSRCCWTPRRPCCSAGISYETRRAPATCRVSYEMPAEQQDRKSTRLNSSHTVISYAVFCLKKKIKTVEMRNSKTIVEKGGKNHRK